MTGNDSGLGVLVGTPAGEQTTERPGRVPPRTGAGHPGSRGRDTLGVGRAGTTLSGWRARAATAVSVGGVKPGSGGRPSAHADERAGSPAPVGTREVG
ncbi:hypothetical protein LV75_006756 [Actinokineospora diospyrosa]|uniref:Uncharacterized protein n=1 Tax=Actinokineospora diospyrosa TaxID=103728 RepID=A0ABT1INH4_9PSEU|nr:hypothetical protein [Actinokineospora diospyrosa]